MIRRSIHFYKFGPFCLDVIERQLRRDGQAVALPPKAFDILLVLVSNSGHVLRKDELMQEVWPGLIVEESRLSDNISRIRQALGDDPKEPRYIKTAHRLGYIFVAEVEEARGEDVEADGRNQRKAEITMGKRVNRMKRLWLILACVVLTIILSLWAVNKHRDKDGTIRSIAVLPFKPLVTNNRDEQLEMGMADTLITKLSNIKGIIVRPINTVRKYTDPNHDPLIAGIEQKVDAVLDGSIQKGNERIRVTVKLLDVREGRQIWADSFDEEFKDIISLQDSIARRVIVELAVQLTGKEKESVTKKLTEDPEAYERYMDGRFLWNNRNEENIEKSIAYFQQAIEKDPNFALAYVGLADCYNVSTTYGVADPGQSLAKAKEAAVRALELDSTLAEAHTALANATAQYDWNWQSAERGFKRAIELNPNSANAHYSYAMNYLAPLGKYDEAIAEMNRAIEIDLSSLIIKTNLGLIHYYMGKYDLAIEQYERILKLETNYPTARLRLMDVFAHKGRYKEALAQLGEITHPKGSERPDYLEQLRDDYETSGGRYYWQIRLKQEVERKLNTGGKFKSEYVSSAGIASLCARSGDIEETFKWLEKAYQERDPSLKWLKLNPAYNESIRSDPRYVALLRRINLVQ
jgi:DNA-binding winged helix-turn-helix (wHTH) protein/TolB-like protein/Tfp pilus assembly protein PilF